MDGDPSHPVAVVVFVACLPVLVLGAGAALHHLLGDDLTPASVQPAAELAGPVERPTEASAAGAASATRKPGRAGKRGARRRLLADYLAVARTHLADSPEAVEPTPAWCRRVTGCSAGTSVKLAAALRAELANPPAPAALAAATAGRDRKERAA